MRFTEGLSAEQRAEAVSAAIAEHREQWLLAFVFFELRTHDLLGIKTEMEKMLVLAALNLVECIAEAAPASA